MASPLPTLPPGLWVQDGSLRDVYIFSTNTSDWKALYVVLERYRWEYFREGIKCSRPPAEAIFEDRDHVHLLRIHVESAEVNCHFFVADEIELDIDPRQVDSHRTHEALLHFVEVLAQATNKPATITPENCSEKPLLTYWPDQRRWVQS